MHTIGKYTSYTLIFKMMVQSVCLVSHVSLVRTYNIMNSNNTTINSTQHSTAGNDNILKLKKLINREGDRECVTLALSSKFRLFV